MNREKVIRWPLNSHGIHFTTTGGFGKAEWSQFGTYKVYTEWSFKVANFSGVTAIGAGKAVAPPLFDRKI